MLATVLKQRRIELKLTQQAVAEQLHTTRQTISNWENGKNFPDVPMLIAISDFYQLSLDTMLKEDHQYVQKVTTDYQFINQSKKSQRLDQALIGCTIFLVIGLILITCFSHQLANSLSNSLILSITIILVGLTYLKSKQFSPPVPGVKPPLFIPRTFGIGLSINPNHPIGKLIWWFIILFMIGSLIPIIFND